MPTTHLPIRGNRPVIWLHADHLRDDNPALRAYPDAPVIFVFDETFLGEARFAFHRLFFIYESVVEIFAARNGITTIRRGTVPETVIAFAQEQNADRVITTATLGSRFAEYCRTIGESFPLTALPVPQLVADVTQNGQAAPKRFSAWWRLVEDEAIGS